MLEGHRVGRVGAPVSTIARVRESQAREGQGLVASRVIESSLIGRRVPAPDAGSRALSIADVARATAEHYNMRLELVLGRDRGAQVAWVRHVAMYLSRECVRPRPSYPDLGRFFGRDHTTCISSVSRVLTHANAQDWENIRAIQARLEPEAI